MTLPTSRDITAAPGGVVPSSLLNDLQDAIITLNTQRLADEAQIAAILAGRSNARTRIITPLEMSQSGSAWALQTGVFPYWEMAATTAGTLIIPIRVTIGERILSVSVLVSAAAVVTNVTSSLRKVVAASGGANPGSESSIVIAQNMPSAVTTMQRITCTPAGAGYVTVADEFYFLRVAAANSAGTKQVMRAEYISDVP